MPPTDKFPTEIIGNENLMDFRNPKRYNCNLKKTNIPYINEIGDNTILKMND